uniref:Uncharacterized protein n=1 Tax=Acrobeloides nanus TaxID=290746 RepID=A0A914DRU5_9BILA
MSKNFTSKRLYHHIVTNAQFYSLRDILESKFKGPVDYENDKKDLIWSLESKNHPDFGKVLNSVGGMDDRISQYSLYATFTILGSVILFIIFIFFYQEFQ